MREQSCPWLGYPQQIDPHPFCEERLCGWIAEPANTWTNIGYLIVAVLIYRSESGSNETRKLFVRAMIALFIASSVFHATGTVAGKLADVSAMFFLSVGVLSLSLRKLLNWSNKQTEIFNFSALAGSLVFLFITRVGNILFATQVVLTLAIEVWMTFKKIPHLRLKQVSLSALTLLISFSFWIMDVTKVICDPHNHFISGHGIWHLLSALSIYLLFKAYP